MRYVTAPAVFGFVLFTSTALFAQRDLRDIPDPDPELERQSFQVAEGFEVNLFAADPKIAKPIQMNFDARGRLWIASSEIYPHIQPGQEADDRILIVEDTDGDGTADKTTIFAGGLLIPTGVEPGDGGAYVADSTELVHLKDLDGDDRADERRVLLSGFGTEDTHHILHTFRWGIDGTLYFNQSIYIHSHIETPWGVRRLGGGGIWQFRPENQRLEILCRGFVNPWGHQQDDWGQSFATDGAYGEGVNYVFPGSVFVTAPGATRLVKGLNPGSPKHCGLEIASGTHLPEDWRGNILTNDFRGHRVCRFVISEDNSGYASREQSELIKTSHVAFRPIDIKMGPDGAIYIADWYNPIIQHGEVDFRDPRRDHTHGRIWRVTAKGRPLVKPAQIAGASVRSLLELLKSPELFNRHHAKRQLKERGAAAVLAELAEWVARLQPGQPGYEHHRLEALWTYQSLDVVEPKLLDAVLQSSDHRARAAALRVASQWGSRINGPTERLAKAVGDDHPRVRLEAVRALALIPEARSAELALQALDRPIDAFLDFALWQTARDLQDQWLPAVERGELDFGNVSRLLFALQSVNTPAIVGPLVQLLKNGRVPGDREESVLTLVGTLGGPAELRLVFDLAVTDSPAPGAASRKARLISALSEAAERRKIVPQGELAPLGQLFGSNDELNAAVCRAVGAWKVESLRDRVTEIALNPATPATTRRAALDGLVRLGGAASRATMEKLAAAERPQEVRMAAASALIGLDVNAGAELALSVMADTGTGDNPAPVFETLLQHKQGPKALLAAIGDRKLPEDVAKIGIRAARTTGRDLSDVVAALNKSAGLTGAERILSPEEMKKMAQAVLERGDAARGEKIYRRADQTCLKCHSISGAGGLVGPDLASIGASAQIDYLIDSLLQPGKQIKENYHSLVVATSAGKVISGVKVRQTDSELILRNADDREVGIPLGEIEEQKAGGSLMPAGLIDTLTQPELVDLVRFLSELGKVGPYAPGKSRLARRWEALDPGHPDLREILRGNPAAVVIDPRLTWNAVYSRVSGGLPLEELPTVVYPISKAAVSFVRCRIEVGTAGKVRLLVNSPAGIDLWIDGKAVLSASELTAELSAGMHIVTARVDRSLRTDELRLELDDVPGSPAQARFVGGK